MVYTGKREPNPHEPGPSPISPKWALQRTAKSLLPRSQSLLKCYHVPRAVVEVWRSPTRETAAYRGLCTCQSVWCCPVCSAKIAATRAAELTDAIATHRSNGGTVLLLTFTHSHTRHDTLADLVARQMAAHQTFWRQGTVRRLLDQVGYIGRVSSFEVTFGHSSGWHPHRHVALFVDSSADPHHVQHHLASTWSTCAARHGLTASLDRGLDARGGEAAGQYVAKLGLEVALAVRKLGRGERYGVWQLLNHAPTSAWARCAFIDFARTMKGKRQLVWSKGLKALLGVDEQTDQDIMESGGDQDEAWLADLTHQLWKGVYRNEIRGDLLRLLGIGDVQAARQLLAAYGLDETGLTTG